MEKKTRVGIGDLLLSTKGIIATLFGLGICLWFIPYLLKSGAMTSYSGLIGSGCFVIYMVTWVGMAKYKINHRDAK